MKFEEFPLREEIQQAIQAMGFESPTPIQEKTIPLILEGERDIIGLAETGSGKTASFGLPMLNMIDLEKREIQGLILSPTRELCQQICREMERFASRMQGIRITPIYGGAPFPPQKRALKAGSHIIVATPGRLLDLIKQGEARLETLRFLVLDEADIMLNMGFKDELDAILEAAPEDRLNLLFSATMPPEVARIADNYMKDPQEVAAGEKNKASANVEHSCYMVHAKDKFKALKRLVDSHPGIYGIVFCRTRAGCQTIADKMIKEGYPTDALHGDLSQNQREYVMKKFRDRSLQLLVATDIAARGLDVSDLTHVIHYDLPDEIEVYNHRSGRTGRAGKQGRSYAIIHMKEKYRIRKIERIIGRSIEYRNVPTGDEICRAQLLNLIDRVTGVDVDESQISPFMDVIEDKLSTVSREELIHRFVSLEFNRFLDYYGKERDILSPSGQNRDRGDRRDRDGRNDFSQNRFEGDFIPLSISVGKRDKIMPQEIIGLVNKNGGKRKIPLGKILIGPSSSIVNVAADEVEFLASRLNRQTFRGRRLKVSIVNKSQAKPSGKKGYPKKKKGK
ncbi:MAG: DEAD/DEAH box helicase [Spirochaetales bacterium]|nr:DEAD/DEAH box helicase [Spirochaetales bacterium]